MRVLITADPYIPVPPVLYGGIERVIDLLVRQLARRGHEVTLVAHRDSHTDARLISYGRDPHVGWRARAGELADVGAVLWRLRRDVDVIHSFGRLAALVPVLPLRHVPKIQSYQRFIPWSSVGRARRLAGSSLALTCCSTSALRDAPADEARRSHVIPNGVDVRKYTGRPAVAGDAPLVFLGRLDPIKGAHHAIAIARGANRRLVIAGNRLTGGPDAGYFDERIAPHVDGDRVRYVGPVDDAAKDRLLGAAAALLMPIEWDEPFGIVMIEAFACGTPVIAFARGSVPDIVRDGVNGYCCRTVDEASGAVAALSGIDRRAVRADCEARFSGDAIGDMYESLYGELIDRTRTAPARRAFA